MCSSERCPANVTEKRYRESGSNLAVVSWSGARRTLIPCNSPWGELEAG